MASSSGPAAVFPPVLTGRPEGAPAQIDLDRCVHCGLCLNACPTYRDLAWEMDSPRGRVYQMVRVATGQDPITPHYVQHINLCLACRACETACPSLRTADRSRPLGNRGRLSQNPQAEGSGKPVLQIPAAPALGAGAGRHAALPL